MLKIIIMKLQVSLNLCYPIGVRTNTWSWNKLLRITSDFHVHMVRPSLSKRCCSNDITRGPSCAALLCWSSLHTALLPLLTPWLSTHFLFLPTPLGGDVWAPPLGGDVWAPPRGAPWKTPSCAFVHTPGNTRERLRLIRRSNTAALSVVAV